METTQIDSSEVIVYDLNELRGQTEFPASLVRLAIRDIIRPIIIDKQRFRDVDLGVGELIQDIDRHGEGLETVTVSRRMGGIAIDTFNYVKEHDSVRNGLGRMILEQVFGDDLSVSTDGIVYEGHLFIRPDSSTDQSLRNSHAA